MCVALHCAHTYAIRKNCGHPSPWRSCTSGGHIAQRVINADVGCVSNSAPRCRLRWLKASILRAYLLFLPGLFLPRTTKNALWPGLVHQLFVYVCSSIAQLFALPRLSHDRVIEHVSVARHYSWRCWPLLFFSCDLLCNPFTCLPPPAHAHRCMPKPQTRTKPFTFEQSSVSGACLRRQAKSFLLRPHQFGNHEQLQRGHDDDDTSVAQRTPSRRHIVNGWGEHHVPSQNQSQPQHEGLGLLTR